MPAALQIAMMGGSMGDEAPGQAPQHGPAAPARDAPAKDGPADKRGKATKAMGVSEFLAQGAGAALPRGQQAKKDRERDKRTRGQSSHVAWKSEAEMVLRQQFDS